MKKVVINIILIVAIFVIYFLHANFFSWFTIAGVMPNLFVILILFIGLFSNKNTAIIYGLCIGLILDLVIGKKIGINMFALGLIAFLAFLFDKNFSKDSRATIMFMVLGSTVIYEVFVYVANYIIFSSNIDIMNFIRTLVIEVTYNLLLTIIIYPIIQRSGYYIENQYKGNKILTRYF